MNTGIKTHTHTHTHIEESIRYLSFFFFFFFFFLVPLSSFLILPISLSSIPLTSVRLKHFEYWSIMHLIYFKRISHNFPLPILVPADLLPRFRAGFDSCLLLKCLQYWFLWYRLCYSWLWHSVFSYLGTKTSLLLRSKLKCQLSRHILSTHSKVPTQAMDPH